MEPEKLLDNLYESMPSVPGIVFFARKMNKAAGSPDTYEDTRSTLNMLIKLISEIDLNVAEAKHLEFLNSNKNEEESVYTVSSEEKPKENPFIASKVAEVGAQLEQLNELDQKLNSVLYGIEDKIKQVKQQLDMGNNLADSFAMEQQGLGNPDFSALFEEKSTEASSGFQMPNLDPLPPLPPLTLTRQIAAPPPPATININ